ncbi:cytidylate kinase [Syntrophotalea carbinolica DSM 2380]|uniref:Cytidylate kinase n=1 Tax=Syntrophotalea carbinolica (strain DSM 2380 / NBRC 103641 / GraBd1) TaxID=338963 RepID=KCY_SYNC1|nr:(d)CMP kinase [Syntrophotalea carbinolica]Q3A3D2.1 RecName: Full=Cytidylate kinase; Short=CK; AltName: Full=Cytidine monophosphate kinase; Short=CMP kinase [Syntrophotalea carbinolica DSM 2380]ABA89125.1 cytidylate kinase [Syntrophotalea carbinolica DSM 2380]
MNRQLIIAIDGPSGVGKSTLSRRLAQQLRYVNIDTGAMYRCVALAAHRAGLAADDEKSLQALCADMEIRFVRKDGTEKVLLNGEDVSEAIRTPEISLLSSRVSAQPTVRQCMLGLQRQMGEQGGVVLEGRDIGTVVFPSAEVKFFLAATARERGKRRYLELKAKGMDVDLDQTIAEVEARDAADSGRLHAPLRQAEDAVLIDTTCMNIDQVLERMLQVVAERQQVCDPSKEGAAS